MAYAVPAGTELVERVGSGTTFDVALVRDGADVLVCKRLTSRALREPAARAAMAREVGLLALARHETLPALVRSGEDEHGPFALERRVPGASLGAVAAALRPRGQVPGEVVLRVARRAAAGLAALHALADAGGPLGVVHGDLTPDHVFCAPGDAIGFVDFGAARFRGMAPELETADRGTLPFVAPEVARGEEAPAQRHDVYALAATLLAFATGRRLTSAAGNAGMLLEVGERGLAPDAADGVPGLAPAVRDALRAALAFDPSRRVATALAFAAELDRAKEGD